MKDLPAIRRSNLSKLVHEFGLAEVARRTKKPASQISDMLASRKSFGEKVARAIEFAWDSTGTAGWLDSNQGVPSASSECDDLAQSTKRLKSALPTTVTSSELATIAGVGNEVAAQWINGAGPEVTLEQAVAIQNAYGINAVWLTKGVGVAGVAIRHNDEFRPVAITKWSQIAVVGHAQLGDNGHWSDLEYPVGHGDGYIDFPSRDPDAYALKCEGESMRPRIQAGEYVIIEPGHEPAPGDDVLLKAKDGRVMVKRLLYRRAGRVHVISVNDAHPPQSFDKDEIDKIHFVRAICRPSCWRPE